ncbi:MAG: tetratricopeptide repeat protein [Anaerolineaceae bacterium]|nr:MAG: tetratricopeptide repeat protein [Anaerolineaceae bacterium]
MRLKGEKLRLSRGGRHSNPWRMLVYIVIIAAGVLILRLNQVGEVQPLFLPTQGPTRGARSFAEEAEVHFFAGDLQAAIDAYQAATVMEPGNAELFAKLARSQTYSSSLLTTLDDRRARLAEARDIIDYAVEISPENVTVHAIRALVYDWSATAEVRDTLVVGDVVRVQANVDDAGRMIARIIESEDNIEPGSTDGMVEEGTMFIFSGVVEEKSLDQWVVGGRTVEVTPQTLVRNPNRREEFLTEAENAANRASSLDPGNILAQAFKAEVQVDEGEFALALDNAQQAAQAVEDLSGPFEYAMDVHRVYATVLENYGYYLQAIEEYQKAAEISPNLTFLYLQIGANYRELQDIDNALYYFDKAVKINDQLKIKDPTPYLAIGKTYQWEGEFFISAINIERALEIDPANPDIYGRLGIVYFQARNYESAIDILECAVRGCTVEENRERICRFVYRLDDPECEQADEINEEVLGLELGPKSVEYYYTYGSVLAAFQGHEDYPGICNEAEEIFAELMTQFSNDALVVAIVAEGQAICGGTALPPEIPPEPTLTPSP